MPQNNMTSSSIKFGFVPLLYSSAWPKGGRLDDYQFSVQINRYVLAPDLLGKKVPVRRDVNGIQKTSWETVELVESIGMLKVQHITVGDKCFWAGENKNGYILHRNTKIPDGDSITIRKGLNLTTVRPDDLKNISSQKVEHHASTHTTIHANETAATPDGTGHAVQLIGKATVHHDFFMHIS
jgi:hypothetical protein